MAMAGFELVKLHDLSNLSATYLPYNIPSSLLSVYLYLYFCFFISRGYSTSR